MWILSPVFGARDGNKLQVATTSSKIRISRKRLGQLEAEILALLAGAEDYLSTQQLREQLAGNPAHTTVNTVLFRLLDRRCSNAHNKDEVSSASSW